MAIHHSHVHMLSDMSPPPASSETTHADYVSGQQAPTYSTVLSFPSLSIPFLSLLSDSVYPLRASRFPSQEPITLQPLLTSRNTQPELWVHSPLIHRQSYLRTGTIATERTQLRAAARRKIALLPQGCETLSIQQHHPGSLSLPHIKSFSLCVEKKMPASLSLIVVQMELLSLQCNRRQMTNGICARCLCVSAC